MPCDASDTFCRATARFNAARRAFSALAVSAALMERRAAALPRALAALGIDTGMFAYAPSVEESTAVLVGSPLTSMNPRFSGFSSPSWEWDGTQGVFLRFQTNGAADSASSGVQIFATNVIVLQVGIDVVEDIPTTRLVNQGKGWIATGGSIVPINWYKATPESPIILTTDDGEEVRLGVGNTWIELIPNESSDVDAGVLTIN